MLEKISKDMVAAMKSGDKERLSTLRMVKAQIDLEKINKKKDLLDEDVISIVVKQVKMREDSIQEFKKANRNDLIDKTLNELAILKEYLPVQLSLVEIDQVVEEVFQIVHPTSSSDMGRIMKEIIPRVKGKADMGLVNEKIKEKLAKL